MKLKMSLWGIVLFLFCMNGYATADKIQLQVWANEAIIATYTYNYKTYLEEQKQIARYFTTKGWISYSKALNESKLPAVIQKNNYDVTAVAIKPPIITRTDSTHWEATMPVLVQFTNPQYQQQQNLKVILGFTVATSGEGVRGFSVTSLQSTVIKPPCKCEPLEEVPTAPINKKIEKS